MTIDCISVVSHSASYGNLFDFVLAVWSSWDNSKAIWWLSPSFGNIADMKNLRKDDQVVCTFSIEYLHGVPRLWQDT